MMDIRWKNLLLLAALLLALPLASCSDAGQPAPQGTATPIPPTRTPFPPSPTPIPTAAVVNDQPITLAVFQSELARYKAAVGRELNQEDRELVIRDLIHQVLLAQAAKTEGYQVSDEELESRLQALDGSDGSLQDWLANYGYTEETFRETLRTSLAAAWMRDEILADVPEKAEQIRAKQILFYDQNLAQSVLDTLNSGVNFEDQARKYDPQTRGELGWFPRGYLTLPELDPILFDLEVGETTDIIETEIGYHIIKVVDKSEDRPLDPAVRQVLQDQALQDWLARRWKLSTIEITISQ